MGGSTFSCHSYMEDGVYLLPGETAERIETAGMYQQLDLFSMFTEQAGNLAMKQAETVTPIRSETKIPPGADSGYSAERRRQG